MRCGVSQLRTDHSQQHTLLPCHGICHCSKAAARQESAGHGHCAQACKPPGRCSHCHTPHWVWLHHSIQSLPLVVFCTHCCGCRCALMQFKLHTPHNACWPLSFLAVAAATAVLLQVGYRCLVVAVSSFAAAEEQYRAASESSTGLAGDMGALGACFTAPQDSS